MNCAKRWLVLALNLGVGMCATACLAPKEDGADSGINPSDDTDEPTDETTDDEPVTCDLPISDTNPTVTLSGRLCGETIALTTRAGAVIHLGRSQPTDPESEIRAIEVLGGGDPNAQSDLATAQFLVNMSFETGPELATPLSTHNLATGVFSLCGFGTVVMLQGPVTFEMAGVDDGAPSGDIDMTLSGILVGGFSPQYGQTRVESCGGELELTLRGRYVHQ